MAELDPVAPAAGAPNCKAAAQPHANGTSAAKEPAPRLQGLPPQADASGAQPKDPMPLPGDGHDDRSGLERAEEIVDELAARVSSLTAAGGRKFLRLMSRARESTQDFWAEVEDFRRRKKS
jgi:hypothetical protein